MTYSNKQLILDVYSKIFGQGDLSFADAVIADDYIQHNPMVKTGKAGFVDFLNLLKQIPKPDSPKKPFMRLISDNNFIAVHTQIEFMGKENATIDLYRIENGLLAEHWDAVQEIVDSKPKVIGSVEINHKEQTIENKEIIHDFVTQVLIEKQTTNSSDFLSENLSITDFSFDYDKFKLHRLIGEKNFVLTQSEVEIKGEIFVQYDIYSLSKQLILEHWAVKQSIPKEMAHTNGMI